MAAAEPPASVAHAPTPFGARSANGFSDDQVLRLRAQHGAECDALVEGEQSPAVVQGQRQQVHVCQLARAVDVRVVEPRSGS